MAYKGKVGLVTGAASGMGKIITTRMVKKGMQIAAIDTNKDGLKELGKKYNNVMPLECDVCSFQEMKEVVEKTESRLGDISSFIHAAAIMPAEPILSTNPDRTMKLMDINYQDIQLEIFYGIKMASKTLLCMIKKITPIHFNQI